MPTLTLVILAVAVLAAMFVMFLVLSKVTSGIDNSLYKLEYMVRKECDARLETLEFKYKIKAANKTFDEQYGAHVKHLASDIQKAVDGNG